MTPLTTGLSLSILVTAFGHIWAEYRGPRWLVYVCKPLTTTQILLLALLLQPAVSSTYRGFILAGLLFSLAGDIFLMLPQDRFIHGLVSFLLAHLFYIAAFLWRTGPHVTPIFLGVYLVYAGIMLTRLWPHLGKMRLPVLVYLVVILVMGWQAWEQWGQLHSRSALLATLGAALFVVSDSLLALDRFRGRFGPARGLVLSTYYGAQWLIALSVQA